MLIEEDSEILRRVLFWGTVGGLIRETKKPLFTNESCIFVAVFISEISSGIMCESEFIVLKPIFFNSALKYLLIESNFSRSLFILGINSNPPSIAPKTFGGRAVE